MPALKQTIKSALLSGARLVGSAAAAPPGALVLMYHSVGPAGLPYTIAPEIFEAQMEHLLALGRPFLTVRELGAAITTGRVPVGAVCVTFDDAFVNAASSIRWLVERGGKVTLFVVTTEPGYNHWDVADPAIPRMDRMSWDQVGSLAELGLEIGSHTVNHARLTTLGSGPLHEELLGSRTALQERLGLDVESLAYPYGAFDAEVLRVASATGYNWACSTQYAYATAASQPLLIPRMEPDTLDELVDLAEGRSHLFYRATALAQRTKNRLLQLVPRSPLS
jgi:peptidoglycan/xylan/chitin deacetylase (PgdA/CDA1 family)